MTFDGFEREARRRSWTPEVQPWPFLGSSQLLCAVSRIKSWAPARPGAALPWARETWDKGQPLLGPQALHLYKRECFTTSDIRVFPKTHVRRIFVHR